jgi:hypothetical protein
MSFDYRPTMLHGLALTFELLGCVNGCVLRAAAQSSTFSSSATQKHCMLSFQNTPSHLNQLKHTTAKKNVLQVCAGVKPCVLGNMSHRLPVARIRNATFNALHSLTSNAMLATRSRRSQRRVDTDVSNTPGHLRGYVEHRTHKNRCDMLCTLALTLVASKHNKSKGSKGVCLRALQLIYLVQKLLLSVIF